MQAYLNDEKVKEKYIARVTAHAKADEIIKGKYWENGRGCAVGCTIEGSDHGKYEIELGIPRVIARLEDRIFEGLPNDKAKKFPLEFLNAVNVGADLSMVMPKFFVWLLGDKKDGVINFAKGYKKSEKAINDVLRLYQQTVGGKTIEKATWKAAFAAADAYAYAADDDDAYAADDDVAYAAAYAAVYAATAYADAKKTGKEEYYSKMANKLLEILKDTK